MSRAATLGVVFWTLAAGSSPAADLTPDQVRDAYREARPRLEAFWKTPASYAFQSNTKRMGVPAHWANVISATDQTSIRVRGAEGRWRVDFRSPEAGGTAETVVVSTKAGRFHAAKEVAERRPKIDDRGAIDGYYTNAEKSIAATCRAAATLYNRVDVADILLGDDYRLTVSPDGKPGEVTVEFTRILKPEDENKRQFVYTSGRITFLRNLDWAISSYSAVTNTGLTVDGTHEYQEVAALKSRTMLKRLRMSTTSATSPVNTIETLEAESIRPGPVDDRIFDPDALGKD